MRSGQIQRFLLVALTICACGSARAVQAQISVTQPAAGANVVGAAQDWATSTFQDPMDMSQRTDLGWWQFSSDLPAANLTNQGFSSGVFTATTTSTQPRFVLLQTGLPANVAVQTGRNGNVYPIDSTLYGVIAYRAKLPQSGQGMFEYWPGDIYTPNTLSRSRTFPAYGPLGDSSVAGANGWHIYIKNVRSLGIDGFSGSEANLWGDDPGQVGTLHLVATNKSSSAVALDWVRIVPNDSTLFRTIQWTGSSSVDIFLDTDNSYANGTLGTIARAASGSSLSYFVGALPPGNYYVAIRPAGSTSTPKYSPGFYRVTAIPTLTFLSPSDEGSDDDYASAQLKDLWDMNALTDVDTIFNITGFGVRQITAEREDGTSLGSVRVASGTSTAATAQTGNIGDPYAYLIWAHGKRASAPPIDSDRYRILTLEAGVTGKARNLSQGSVGRLVWHVKGEADGAYNVSQDIPLHHLADRNVVQKLSLDMQAVPLESDPGGTRSSTGWFGPIDGFRYDFHEFASATGLFIKRVKLASLELTGPAYVVRWSYNDPGPSANAPYMILYYDVDTDPDNGVGGLIGTGIDPRSGEYIWNTTELEKGEQYYVCASFGNGSNENVSCSRWPVLVGDSYTAQARIVLNRTRLIFGAVNAADQKSSRTTAPQEVVVNGDTKRAFGWTAALTEPTRCSFLQISPTTGQSGSSFTVTLSPRYYSVSPADCRIVISSDEVTNPQVTLPITVKVYKAGSSAPPIGRIDTPAGTLTNVQGSLGITGWAVDDLELVTEPPSTDPCSGGATIWRDPLPGEHGDPRTGKICLGSASFIPDARPDVANTYPGYPANYQAGWGFMVLTNMLPNGGNGTFRLHVYILDRDGHRVYLGSRTITTTNSKATLPFGAIDTPGQGGIVDGTSFINWGWALAPKDAYIPTDGSTITVYVDGRAVGHPVYNLYRVDIATLFPGYANANAAVGYLRVDSSQLDPTVVHTIEWSVTDSKGRRTGIGSRFFRVRRVTE